MLNLEKTKATFKKVLWEEEKDREAVRCLFVLKCNFLLKKNWKSAIEHTELMQRSDMYQFLSYRKLLRKNDQSKIHVSCFCEA